MLNADCLQLPLTSVIAESNYFTRQPALEAELVLRLLYLCLSSPAYPAISQDAIRGLGAIEWRHLEASNCLQVRK